jgi:hypothetical protein
VVISQAKSSTAAALREHAERYLNHEFDYLDQGSGTMDSHLLARFSFVSLRRLVLRLLYTILLFMGPRYPAILLCCSKVILGGAFSTHLLGKERNRKLKAG